MKIQKHNLLFSIFTGTVALGVIHLPVAYADQPAFSSRPDSPNVFYLDFDGEDETDSIYWNPIVALPSELEDNEIRDAWGLAAEAFRPFDVNVTTDRSVFDATPVTQRQKCIITNTDHSEITSISARGVAKLNSFGQDISCWSFEPSSYSTIAHELGHTVGLIHDGVGSPYGHTDYDEEYHDGEDGWVPIMGSAGNQPRQLYQWSKGEYFRSNNIRDDVANLGERLGAVIDDVGDSIASAASAEITGSNTSGYTTQLEGLISNSSDTDFYRIDVPAGYFEINTQIEPFYVSEIRGTMPIDITWYNGSGEIISEDSADQTRYPSSGHRSTLILESTNGQTFYVAIKGAEVAAAGNTSYGSIGSYSVSLDLNPIHAEVEVGDFSDAYELPSELDFSAGENKIRGEISGEQDGFDYITFTVPSGYQIGMVQSLTNSTSLGLAHRFGSFSAPGLSGGTDGIAVMSTDLAEQYLGFTNLGAGDHTFVIANNSNANVFEEYSLSFDITPKIVSAYDENVDGDLSGVAEAPSNLGTLDSSVVIRGDTGINGDSGHSSSSEYGDADFFTVTVPAGYTLGLVPTTATAFISVISSKQIGLPRYSHEGYKEYYVSNQTSLRYQDYDAGTYTFNVQTVYGGTGSYELQFELIPIAENWASTDIGDVSTAGSMLVATSDEITLTASGADIFGNIDEFHFAYIPVNGDVEITARVDSLSYTHPWAKAGVMIRETLDADSSNAMTLVSASRGISSQYRQVRGASTSYNRALTSATAPYWVRLSRSDDVFISCYSSDGVNWITSDTWTIPMAEGVFVGLASTSHKDGVVTTAVFDNVSVVEQSSDLGIEFDATQYDAESAPSNERVIRNMGTKVGFITNGSWVSYEAFDFGSAGASNIDVVASSNSSGGTISLRLDSPDGTTIGSVSVDNTGDWNDFSTFSGTMSNSAIGERDLYFVFSGTASGLMDIQSFTINR